MGGGWKHLETLVSPTLLDEVEVCLVPERDSHEASHEASHGLVTETVINSKTPPPLPSECGSYKTVRTRILSWLAGETT